MLGDVAACARRSRAGDLAGGARRLARAPMRATRRSAPPTARSATLDAAINGRPAACPAASAPRTSPACIASSSRSGSGARPRDAAPSAARLARDVARLRAPSASIEIDPLDYSLRAHEVLEDTLHLQLAGQREPVERRRARRRCARTSAGPGVVLGTLRPMLARRDPRRAAAGRARADAGSRPRSLRAGVAAARCRAGTRSASASASASPASPPRPPSSLAYVPELIDPRPPRPAQRAVRGRDADEQQRAVPAAAGLALGAGAAIDRVLGAGGGARPRGGGRPAGARPAPRRARSPFEGAHQAGHPHAAPAARDRRRLRRDRRRRAPSSPTALAALSDARPRADRAATTPCSARRGEGPTPDSGILGAARRRPTA